MSRRAITALCVLSSLLIGGCAKLPDVGVGGRSKRLLFKFRVAGEIRNQYVYIVALRPSLEATPPTQGPIPVIAPPWGNGFVAGGVTHFVRWDPFQSPRFLVYAFRDLNLLDFFQTGTPINVVDVNPGDKTIQFELELSQLAPVNTDQYQSIQVNFLTMDRVPQGTTGSKVWDALGDGRLPGQVNEYISVPLRTSGLYDNARFGGLEPPNDTIDPDLDITDFSVEVRSQ